MVALALTLLPEAVDEPPAPPPPPTDWATMPSAQSPRVAICPAKVRRSEEHTSEIQSLMRNSYAVFCLKKKNKQVVLERQINKENTNKKHNKVHNSKQR